jgi:hypothetical protein
MGRASIQGKSKAIERWHSGDEIVNHAMFPKVKTKPRTFPSSQRGDFSHDRAKERKVLR